MIVIGTTEKLNSFHAASIEINLDEMSGDMVTGDDGRRYVDRGDSDYVLFGPYITLDEGYYTINIDYCTDKDNTVDVHSDRFLNGIISSSVKLKKESTHKRFNIRIREKVDDFSIRVKYSGQGHLEINRIQLLKIPAV